MAIRIVRNDNGNCINFVGSSNPVYFNACLSGEVDANDSTLVNVVNDIHTASSGQTEYEFFNIPFTEWEDRDGNSFADAAAVAAYITQEGNVATGTDVAAGYEGVWDASTNTPDLTTLTPANGDWFYVSVAGTYDSVEYKVNDIIKYSDATSAWNLIPNETVRVDELDETVAAIIFSTESALFNTNSEVYSDGDRGQVDPAGQEAGWYYTNTSSGLGHIEWHYVENINPENVMTLETLKGMYALVKMESVTGLPQFEVYTQPTGDAADATATYRSLKVYNANVSAVSSYEGEEVLLYWGQDPTDKFPTAPHIELTLDSTISAGPAGTDEDILFGAFATVNSAASGTYEFIAKKLGYINNTHAREYLLDVNDPVAAAAETDVQSSTVINFTKDASNTSIVLSHDGSHYGVNTITAVLESDGTISIKGVGENGEDTVTNINYQNVQIAGVSPANTPAGVVNALNALFTVNPLGAGYVPVTVLPVSDGANVGLNLREGIVPTEGIYSADSVSTTSHGARVWTNETINQHGEFFEFKVTGDGDFVIGLGDDSDDRTDMANDSLQGVNAGFWWALRLTHTSAAAPFVQEHATTALYAGASNNFVWQSGSGLDSNATTSSISTNGEIRDNVLNAEANLYRVGINDNGFVYVSYYDAGRTNNFIEIVRSQTLVPSANYFAAVKLLEGDVKITHTPTVATLAVDAVTGDIDLSDTDDGGSTFGTAEVSIGDTIIVTDRLEDSVNLNDGFVSEVTISQPGEFFEVTVNMDQNHYIGISYDSDYSKSTIISEMDAATSNVTSAKYFFLGGYMNNVSDRITAQVRDSDGSSSSFTPLDGGGVDQETNTRFRVGFDLTGRATLWQTDDGTNYVVVKYLNTASPSGTYRFLWKGASHGAELTTLKKGQLTAVTSVQWRYIESPDGDFYYPLFATTAEAIFADEQAGGSGTYHSHVFVDEPTSATWYMPDTGGVHAGSSAPTESKYTEIPTEADANYAPSTFTTADVSFNENAAVNLQIEPVGTTSYTTTVTGLPTWLAFNGNLIQGTTPYVSSDTTITITVTRANSYGSSTGTFDLTVTDNASLGNLTGWTELDGNFYQPNSIFGTEDAVLSFDTTLGQGQQLTYSYATTADRVPTIGILSSEGEARVADYDAASDSLGSPSGAAGYDFAETSKWDLRYVTGASWIGGTGSDLALVGWSNNTTIQDPSNSNFNVEFKLEYANDGYIRLYKGGVLKLTSASVFSGDQTITMAVFDDDASYSASTNRFIPTNWTIASIGAGSTTPPSGFVDPLLTGEMASSTLMGDNGAQTDSAVQLTDTLEAGKRYIFPQTWLEANVLPYMDSADTIYDEVFVGVITSSPDWADVSAADFDAHFRLGRSASTTSHSSQIKTASTLIDSVSVNSTTDAFYDYALEWDGQDLHVIACNIGDINTEPGVSNGGAFSRTKTESNYSATGALNIGIGADNGAQVNLTTTGLQKIDIPAGPNDILVSEVSEGAARFDVGNGPVESNEITLTAGQTYRFMLSNASIESGDTLTFEKTSDGSAYTTGVTTVGNHGQYLYYVQFAVPADAPPLRAVWNGTDNPPFNIAGSTYVVDTSDADIAGPSGEYSGDLVTGTHAWVELDLRLDPGERVIIPAAFHEDMAAAIDMEPNTSGKYTIGIASPANYSNQRDNSSGSKRVNFFDEHRIGHYRNSSGNYESQLADGTVNDGVVIHTSATYHTQNNFIELDSAGNQLRQGFGLVGGDDPTTVTYANWTAANKHQTAVLGNTYSNLTIVVLVEPNDDGDNVDLSSVDFSLITKQNIPTASSITTSWTKAIDFAGGNERMQQVTSDGYRVPMLLGGLGWQTAAPTTTGYTSNDSNSRPWATSIVFKAHIYNSNQHIWNVGEGAGTTDDNIYLRRASNREIWFGWGRSGTTALNECYVTDIGTAIGSWWGIYVAHNGTRLSASNATAANLAACFDIRVVNLETGAVGSNLSTSANWTSGSTGGRMDYNFTNSSPLMTIGGRGTNRNFRGKIAGMTTTTLRRNVAMPTDVEIGMMVRDPMRWLSDYKVGNDFRLPWQGNDAGFNFAMNDGSSSYATQVWLMGDGTSDAYSQIRNQVFPATTSYTPQNMLGMVSNDIETVTINGLT